MVDKCQASVASKHFKTPQKFETFTGTPPDILPTPKNYPMQKQNVQSPQYAVKVKRHIPSVVVDPRNVVHAL